MGAWIIGVLVATPTLAGGNQWTSIGPRAAEIVFLAVAPSNSDIVYAGGLRRVFRSEDGGESWLEDFAVLSGGFGRATRLAVSPHDPDVLWAGGEYLPLLQSRDGGRSWRVVDLGPGVESIQALALSGSGDVLFAATQWSSSVSHDGGGTWTATPVIDVTQAVFDPVDEERLYVLAGWQSAYRVLRSTDGGRTFHPLDVAAERASKIEHHPSRAGLLYAYTDSGLFKSNDGGDSWSRASAPVFGFASSVHDLAADDLNNLYAATSTGLFWSPDGGHAWAVTEEPSLQGPVTAVAVDPRRTAVAYAAADGTLFRTQSAGHTWARLTAPINVSVDDLAVDPSDSRYVYCVCKYPTSFFRSEDHGSSWRRMMLPTFPNSVAIASRGGSSRLYVAGGPLAWSDDRGETWTVPDTAIGAIADLAVDPQDPLRIFAAIAAPRARGYLLRSPDGGRSWQSIGTGLQTGVVFSLIAVVMIDPQDPRFMYAAGQRGVFRSADAGETWTSTSLTEAADTLALDPRNPQVIIAGLPGGVARSDDRGVSWTRMDGVLPARATALAVDPRDSSAIYAGTAGSGVFRSFDRGVSWFPFGSGPTDPYITALVFGANGNRLYAGTFYSGIFSHDVRRARAIAFR